MGPEGPAGSLGPPSKLHATETLTYIKAIEDRQNPPDVPTDEVISSDVVSFQTIKHRNQVATV